MESLNDLEKKLAQYESELSSITKTITRDVPFLPGQLDGYSESYSLSEFSDPERAKYLQTQIAYLKGRIKNYSQDAESARIYQEQREQENKKWREEKINSTAMEIYQEKMDNYMHQNFWGKAKTLFSGKKPKKMSEFEVVSTYGGQAVDKITFPAIERLQMQKADQLASIKEVYADDSKMLEYAIQQTNLYFDGQIKDLQSTYEKSLSNITEEKREK